ncbi:unnamed protein product [Adineta steineri]|uniref:Uncharacterized protein n=1 Tax=Adineta steineri TaxID=433720 RepID=A0A814QID9_9BILA|nr:unnamed protein product [Adineta steineri]
MCLSDMLKNRNLPHKCSQTISFRLKPVNPVKKNFVSEIYYHPKLEQKFHPIKPKSYVDLSYWHLIDHDMSMIFKHIIINKQCIELNLSGNHITSQGIAILAFRLPNNLTLRNLNLSHNRINDTGVYLLSEVLLPKHSVYLEKLYLSKNGISNDGIRYLSKMLKVNDKLTELQLANNEIGDEGVRQLANILIDYNTTLKVLNLSNNIFITDSSLDYLLELLEYNQTLTKLSIKGCNLSEKAKIKLQLQADGKKNFELEI